MSRGEVLQWSAVLHAGIVDQDVNRTAAALKAVDRRSDQVTVSGVEGQFVDARAVSSQRVRSPGQLCRVTPIQHDRRAEFGEPLCQGEPYPLRSPGDERGLPAEIEHRCASCHDTLPKF